VKISVEDWATVSRLLDEILDLPAPAREMWIDGMPEEMGRFRLTLRELLALYASGEAGDFLATLPKLTAVGLASELPPPGDGATSGVRVGPYRLLREVGRGGMGSVWLAERTDGSLRRLVALKLPHAGPGKAKLAERFARERDILAGLTHANIARLYDAGVTPAGQPYLALEFVEGVSLNAYCDQHRLDITRRLQLFLQVLNAIQYAHAQLVIHRDLKPSNVLVTADGQVRLLDFGIAKLVIDGEARETELTQVGGRALTPDYASPEQIAGRPIGTASDVYSLGVLLYELLTGFRPYKLARDSRGALEEAILAADPARPSSVAVDESAASARGTTTKRLARNLAGDLDTIVLKALKKNPQERYGTAEAFGQDIDRYLHGEAVLAQPDSAWYRGKKLVLRNRLAFGSALAIVTTLAVGLGIALWQANVARTEARTSDAVQSFLEDIFKANSASQSNPAKARDTTARELLDIGASKIDSALAGAPEAQLRVLHTLADMYFDLGLDRQELELRARIVKLTRSIRGDTDEITLGELLALGGVAVDSRDFVVAQQALTEAEGTMDRNGDLESHQRGELEGKLTWLYMKIGQPEKARSHAEKALSILGKFPPSDSYIDALQANGNLLVTLGEYTPAAAALKQSIALAEASDSAKAMVPWLYTELGEAQWGARDLNGAEASFRQALALASATEGPQSFAAVTRAFRLARFLGNTSRLKEGLELTHSTRDSAVTLSRDSGSPDLARLLDLHADLLIRTGSLEEGLGTLTEVDKVIPPEGIALVPQITLTRAAGFIEMGRFNEAESLLNQADKVAPASGPGTGADPALLRTKLLLATNRADEARRAVQGSATHAAPNHALFNVNLESKVLVAEINLFAGDVPGTLASISELRAQIPADPDRAFYKVWVARADVVEGKAKCMTHDAVKGIALLQRAVAVSRELYDPKSSPAIAEAEIALASCLLDAGRREEAKGYLQHAKAIHASHKELGEQYRKPLRQLTVRL
jgi:serine/threonine protein kinase